EDEERRGPGEQAEREERPADGLGEGGGPREERRRGKAHRGDALDEAGRGRELAEAVVVGEREAGQEAEHEEAGVGEGAGPTGAADEEALVGGHRVRVRGGSREPHASSRPMPPEGSPAPGFPGSPTRRGRPRARMHRPEMNADRSETTSDRPEMAPDHPEMAPDHPEMAPDHSEMTSDRSETAPDHSETDSDRSNLISERYKSISERYKSISERYNLISRRYNLIPGRYIMIPERYKSISGRYDLVPEPYESIPGRYNFVSRRCSPVSQRSTTSRRVASTPSPRRRTR